MTTRRQCDQHEKLRLVSSTGETGTKMHLRITKKEEISLKFWSFSEYSNDLQDMNLTDSTYAILLNLVSNKLYGEVLSRHR